LPNLEAFQKRVGSRKAVLEALRAEGLIADSKAARTTGSFAIREAGPWGPVFRCVPCVTR
jgi:hypothetical protein